MESGFLPSVARQAQLTADVSHRPWPLPDRPWSQAQIRSEVLFAHWPVPLDELARLLPPELPVDTFDGQAWLGIVAFRVSHLRLRGLPPVPGLSALVQLEVQAYVSLDGRPGIWLCSFDATRPLLVEAAKRVHRLPAYRARISADRVGDSVRFDAVRGDLAFRAQATGAGDPVAPPPGTLDHFLCERYALYTADGGRLYRADLHHDPWRLRTGSGRVEEATVSPVVLDGEPRLRLAEPRDVLVWSLEEL